MYLHNDSDNITAYNTYVYFVLLYIFPVAVPIAVTRPRTLRVVGAREKIAECLWTFRQFNGRHAHWEPRSSLLLVPLNQLIQPADGARNDSNVLRTVVQTYHCVRLTYNRQSRLSFTDSGAASLKNWGCPSFLPPSMQMLRISKKKDIKWPENTPAVQFRIRLQVTRWTKSVGCRTPRLNFWGCLDTHDTNGCRATVYKFFKWIKIKLDIGSIFLHHHVVDTSQTLHIWRFTDVSPESHFPRKDDSRKDVSPDSHFPGNTFPG